MKHILILIAFFTITFSLKAQDKYEFMIIEFVTYNSQLSVSINGKEFIKENARYLGQGNSGYNANPLINKVNEYQDLGWELMSFNSGTLGSSDTELHFAHLRKKKTETK